MTAAKILRVGLRRFDAAPAAMDYKYEGLNVLVSLRLSKVPNSLTVSPASSVDQAVDLSH